VAVGWASSSARGTRQVGPNPGAKCACGLGLKMYKVGTFKKNTLVLQRLHQKHPPPIRKTYVSWKGGSSLNTPSKEPQPWGGGAYRSSEVRSRCRKAGVHLKRTPQPLGRGVPGGRMYVAFAIKTTAIKTTTTGHHLNREVLLQNRCVTGGFALRCT
jgi:hypothetical protein